MNTQLITSRNAVGFRTARRAVRLVTAAFWIFLAAGAAIAQDLPKAPSKPATPAPYYGDYDWLYRAGVVCGGGASSSPVATKPTIQCGGTLGLGFLDIEAGAMGPLANGSAVSGYLSTNAWVPLVHLKDLGKTRWVPLFVGGYTRMFETGNAVDYGVTYFHPVNESHAIQFEARDYWAFASPSQHNVVFRVAWLLCIPDP